MTEATIPQAAEVPEGGLSEEQAAQQLLSKWTAREPEPKAEATEPEQTQTEQVDAQATEQEQEAEAEDGEVEIDLAGEKFRVPRQFQETATRIQAKAKELEAGATRKFQEAADDRKAVATERAAVTELRKIAEANAELIADHKMVARRMQALETMDISTLDDSTLTRLNAEYTQLAATEKRIKSAYEDSVKQMRSKEREALQARQAHAEKIVSQSIKGWGPEKAKSLAEYAMSRGAPAEALNGITEPWMVEILEDAAYGRQMREHKTTLDKRVAPNTATLKPGASTSPTRSTKAAEEAFAKAKRTHSVEDAAMALLARSNARKR